MSSYLRPLGFWIFRVRAQKRAGPAVLSQLPALAPLGRRSPTGSDFTGAPCVSVSGVLSRWYKAIWLFPKIECPSLVVPIMRTIVYLGLFWGPLFMEAPMGYVGNTWRLMGLSSCFWLHRTLLKVFWSIYHIGIRVVQTTYGRLGGLMVHTTILLTGLGTLPILGVSYVRPAEGTIAGVIRPVVLCTCSAA